MRTVLAIRLVFTTFVIIFGSLSRPRNFPLCLSLSVPLQTPNRHENRFKEVEAPNDAITDF